MTVNDFSDVDFIEVFNDLEPLHEVNERGLTWWEQLVLSGEKLAATSGMDLHGDWDMAMNFATYARACRMATPLRSWPTQSALRQHGYPKACCLHCDARPDGILFHLEDVHKPGFVPGKRYIMTLKSTAGTREYDITSGSILLARADMPSGEILIPKLYSDAPLIENLLCVAPVIHLY